MGMTDFVLAVEEMRALQKKYFLTRNKSVLEASKAQERRVDNMIEEYDYDHLSTLFGEEK
jgi:hypothetical protein